MGRNLVVPLVNFKILLCKPLCLCYTVPMVSRLLCKYVRRRPGLFLVTVKKSRF